MRRTCHLILALLLCLPTFAGITTYQFTSAKWQSKLGATVCDNKTDGWTSDKDGQDYTSSTNPHFQTGVQVTAKGSGAGATSIQSFTDVRRITFNYATGTRTKGTIRIQVGDNAAIDSAVTIGEANHELTIILPETQTGKIKFSVLPTDKSIYINTITIRAKEGGSTPFNTSSFQLVTDVTQLQDSDQIIIGVHQDGVNRIMGYFDENISQNNIHSIKGVYADNRTTVAANDNAIYTLRKTTNSKGNPAFLLVDELRYDEAYLVANGGKTKNRLALWHSPASSDYGDYGYWDISVAANGEATVMSQGVSLGKYLQYNASNSPTLFGCYREMGMQTPVCIYREVPAIGDVKGISASLVNFGEVVMTEAKVTGSKVLTVNANKLEEDITATLKDGTVFSLGTNQIDRDGDQLTIRYSATESGSYTDTLVLSADGITCEVSVLLHVISPLSISEAVKAPDFSLIYLNPVVVTKKYDHYIFVRDDTGAMLIYDNGDGTGQRYGEDLEKGDVLTGVCGRYQNYYGLPELQPTTHWAVSAQPVECKPELVTALDSADVCRFVRIKNATVTEGQLTMEGNTVSVLDKFNTSFIEGVPMHLDAIVMWSWDALELWVVSQNATTPIDVPSVSNRPTGKCYNVLGQEVPADYRGIIIQDGSKYQAR